MKFTDSDALDLSTHLKTTKNRVHRVGIELEGAWNQDAIVGIKKKNLKVPNIERDGSVRFNPEELPEYNNIQWYVGEYPGPPLVVEKGPTDFREWLKVYYPTKVNATCGLHVHMSFSNALIYQRLMEVSYPASIVRYMKDWAVKHKLPKENPLWDRLAGKSIYCQHLFFPDEQVKDLRKDFNQTRHGCRYTVVNFCFSRNKTAEVRLLPAMPTVDLAIDSIENLINVTNAYLVATAKKEVKHSAEIGLNDLTPFNEEHEVRI